MASHSRPPRPRRADARRNRDAIVEAARDIFATEGALASLDGIALRAGVGNATLYRNFPTRDDLLMAVIQVDLEQALTEARDLARDLSPRAALAEWLPRLAWRLRIWHDLPHCIAEARTEPGSSMRPVVATLVEETGKLLDRAKAAGVAQPPVHANEVFELVTALSWAVDRFGDDEDAARRRVAVGTAGLFL